MSIRDAVRPNLVFLGLEAETAETAIGRMAEEMAAASGLDGDRVERALTEREKLGSTSVGNGFAIPHSKLDGLEEIVVALMAFNDGVDFGDSKNGPPVRFFFVVLSPPDQPAAHLQVLSQIARLLKRDEVRERLLAAQDVDAVVRAIEEAADREGL